MSEYSKSDQINLYNSRRLESSKMWILFLFLGWSYGSMDKMGKQILYYITVGGVGLWALYVLFTLNGKVKAYNKKIALEVGLDHNDIAKLGL